MSLIRFVSAERIVAKVYRDLDIRDANWELDAIEWIGDVLRFCEIESKYVECQVTLEVTSFKAALPSDVSEIVDVWRKNPSTFNNSNTQTWVPIIRDYEDSQSLLVVDEESNRPWSYWMNDDIMKFTFESGTVLVRYKGFPRDNKGYPFVPDDQNFEEAAFWYILTRLFLRKYKHPDPQINWQLAKQQYNQYLEQARVSITFPSPDEMEEFVRNWTGISVADDDYKRWASRFAGNKVFPGFGYVDYGTGNFVSLLTSPEYYLNTSSDE